MKKLIGAMAVVGILMFNVPGMATATTEVDGGYCNLEGSGMGSCCRIVDNPCCR